MQLDYQPALPRFHFVILCTQLYIFYPLLADRAGILWQEILFKILVTQWPQLPTLHLSTTAAIESCV